jgi:hypothetical protein
MDATDAANEVDACVPLFQKCTGDTPCCVPYRCLSITFELQCGLEYPPLLDGGP